MNDQTMGIVLGQLRTVLAAIGGLLVARGLVSADGLNEVIGAVVICVPAIWSAWEKIKDTQATAAKEHTALNAGIAIADASVGPVSPVPAAQVQAVLDHVAATPPIPVLQVPPVVPVVSPVVSAAQSNVKAKP